ncbi:MAG: O-antigen ligase family protein [Cytophagales bacterium]|nr:O-antigen ligase family protein [Cytophagales bacterium]
MEKTHPVKDKFLQGLEYFYAVCFSVLIAGFFIYGIHGALQNIVFGLLGGTLILRYILLGKFELYLPKNSLLVYALIYVVFVGIFLLNYNESSEFAHSCSNKVLILLFPLLFSFYPLQNRGMHFFYFWVFATCTLIECGWASYNYYLDLTGPQLHTWSSVIHVYLIPFRIMHHHLGVLVDCVIFLLAYMGLYYFKEKKFLGLLVVVGYVSVLILFLHLLGARLSLVIFYGAIFLVFIYYVFTVNNLWVNISMFLALLLLGVVFVLSTKKLDTLNKKITETIVDINSIKENGPNPDHNISGRIYSAYIGIDFIKMNPWKGYGYYNYESLFAEYYAKYHPEFREDIRLLPANQVIRYLVCIGIPLTVLLVFFLWSPLFLNANYLKILFIGFYAIVFLYCMVEFPLEDNNFFYFFSFMSPWLLHFYASISVSEKVKS